MRVVRGNTRTEDDDVEDEDDKPQQSAAGAVLPAVVQRIGRNGSSEADGGQAELEHDERVESHDGLCMGVAACLSPGDVKNFWRLRSKLGNVER